VDGYEHGIHGSENGITQTERTSDTMSLLKYDSQNSDAPTDDETSTIGADRPRTEVNPGFLWKTRRPQYRRLRTDGVDGADVDADEEYQRKSWLGGRRKRQTGQRSGIPLKRHYSPFYPAF
jgi:hypothetical protein